MRNPLTSFILCLAGFVWLMVMTGFETHAAPLISRTDISLTICRSLQTGNGFTMD